MTFDNSFKYAETISKTKNNLKDTVTKQYYQTFVTKDNVTLHIFAMCELSQLLFENNGTTLRVNIRILCFIKF